MDAALQVTPPEDAALITESLDIAAARGGDLTATIYDRLFQQQPQLEALFVMDSDGAVRGEMLSRTFDAILDFIDARTYAHNFIAAEATTHDGYTVPRPAFTLFFAIVRDSIRDACGAEWTPACDDAWRRLLNDISDLTGAAD